MRQESWVPGQLHPNLSWTHYRTLLRVERKAVRAFYEIEAIRNGWSGRQLERQINSLLFEPLLKSRHKAGVLALAQMPSEEELRAELRQGLDRLALPEPGQQ